MSPRERVYSRGDGVERFDTFDGFGWIGPGWDRGVWRSPDPKPIPVEDVGPAVPVADALPAPVRRRLSVELPPFVRTRAFAVTASIASVCGLLAVLTVLAFGSEHAAQRQAKAAAAPVAPAPVSLPSTPVPTPLALPPGPAVPVVVLDQAKAPDLARSLAERLKAGGWDVPATADFHGRVPATTVYYPPGQEQAARRLAEQFPEIGRVLPAFPGISKTRLSVVVVSPVSPASPVRASRP